MRTRHEIVDREFLELRGKLLEIAASFDRMDRAVTVPETGIGVDLEDRIIDHSTFFPGRSWYT